jgi:hypothetical protein
MFAAMTDHTDGVGEVVLAILDRLIQEETQAIAHVKADLDKRHAFLAGLEERRNALAQNGAAVPKKVKPKVRKASAASAGLSVSVARAMAALGPGPVTAAQVVEHMEGEGYTFSGSTPKDVLVRSVLRRGTTKYGMHKDPKTKRVLWSRKGSA